MRLQSLKNKVRGITAIEVLTVITLFLFFTCVYLTTLPRKKSDRRIAACSNNLKMIGLAFKIWPIDSMDGYPMQVPTAQGGTLEFVTSGTVFPHFLVMSNELSTPKILFCPEDMDSKRRAATVFETRIAMLPPGEVPFTGDSNTSYFVGVDASDVSPTMLLSGDRNITVSNRALNPGLHSLPTNAPVGWTDKMHAWRGGRKGNILSADGSVQTTSLSKLPGLLHSTGVATNRLAVP